MEYNKGFFRFWLQQKMGYTHYWKMLAVPSKEQISKVLIEAVTIREKVKIPLQLNCQDKSLPLFSQDRIIFNGADEQHEDFFIDFSKPFNFSFCKTQYKPYDAIVKLVLISMRNHFLDFKFSSDGNQEWRESVDQYESMFGKLNFSPEPLYEGQQC